MAVDLIQRFDAKDPRLGRHIELDARSEPYFIEKLLPKPIPIKPAEHLPAIPTLDQGHLHEQGILDEPGSPEEMGSCTGNGGTYAMSAVVGIAGLQNVVLNRLGLTNYQAAANERFAIELYHQATQLDGLGGPGWPPDDRGSSGLGVCKALKAAGLVGSYVWATTLQGFATLLQNGGVMIGMPWYRSFFSPDAQGFIDFGAWQTSGIAGGHEVYCEALETWNSKLPARSVIRVRNSWSDSWGDHGCFRMHLSTYVALRAQVDLKQLVAKAA